MKKSFYAFFLGLLVFQIILLPVTSQTSWAAGGMGANSARPSVAPSYLGGAMAGDLSLGGASMPGNEFVSGNYPGAVLMPINLWGSIAKPGIHHVPVRTDLITLLSLAGGPSPDAELDRVTIKRRIGSKEELIKIDADKLLGESGQNNPILEPNDIVVIPRSKPVISNDTATTVAFVGSILSIVLAGVAISAMKR